MPVITLSREYGAGGLTVGCRVAEILGLEFLDSALVDETARRLHMPEEAVRHWDERGEGIILRLLRALQAGHPEYVAGSALPGETYNVPDPARIRAAVREVIEEEARSGDAVLVGRGASFILAGHAGAWHFRLVASRQARIRRVAVRIGVSEEEAGRQVDRADRERGDYLKRNFGVDWRDPLHYALVLNTEVLGCEKAARIMVETVEGSSH